MELGAIEVPKAPARHIKKRALRNKSLTVSFNDKDLRDYITGFHKRKKKRRKEAQRQLQEKERRKRIELRKKRKLERELALYGGPLPAENPSGTSEPDEVGNDLEEDVGDESNASISGTKVYDYGDTTIMVTTSEISREDEDLKMTQAVPKFTGDQNKQHGLQVKKKPFKIAGKPKSQGKAKKSNTRKKGNRKNSKSKR